MTLHRLDRANYGGPLTQGKLFEILRKPAADWPTHTVEPSEELDLYTISHNVYGSTEAWWVVAVCADLEDPMTRIPAGTELTLPPLSWLREKLKTAGKTIS